MLIYNSRFYFFYARFHTALRICALCLLGSAGAVWTIVACSFVLEPVQEQHKPVIVSRISKKSGASISTSVDSWRAAANLVRTLQQTQKIATLLCLQRRNSDDVRVQVRCT